MHKAFYKYFLIIIAICAVFIFVFRGRLPFGKGNTSFAVNQDASITKIELIKGNKKVSLEKSGEKWLVNGKDEARKSAVFFILRTLQEMKIKSPVSAELFDTDIIKKSIEPVKVNVLSRRRLIKSFFVYQTQSNTYGNIMKMKAFAKPYIVYMPGYEDNIGIHFVADELFWKPFQVFHLLPSEILSVQNEIFADTSSSFGINCFNNTFVLTDLKKNVSGWDTLKVKRYLTYFTSVSFETWATELTDSSRKEILSATPLFRITVKPKEGRETILTVWEKWKSEAGVRTPDTDRVWARTNQRAELFIMKYMDLDPILKKISYFFN